MCYLLRASVGNALSALAVLLVLGRLAPAADDLAKPVRLQADGQPIESKNWGHASPCVEDLDGDGLADLIVGDFSGKLQVYKNAGGTGKPTYEHQGTLQGGGVDAEVRIYCCVGAQPRFVDLNGDGLRDLISSSYDPGHCYLFAGLAGGKFAAREELLDKQGIPVRSWPVQRQNHQSFGSFFTPVDWDGDGDSDLLLGCFDGHLKLRVNNGGAQRAEFAAENIDVQAGGQPLKVEKHCCPAVADWDGDGRWDLICGADDGSVTWFRNVGSKGTPQFDTGVTLVAKAPHVGYNLLRFSDADIVPGIRSQVEVVDHNADGKLDLLVGDFCTVYDTREDLTEDEQQQVAKIADEVVAGASEFANKMKALHEDFAKRYPGDAIVTDEANKEWHEAYAAIKKSPAYEKMERAEAEVLQKFKPFLKPESQSAERHFDLAKPHGYVWLYTRQ